MLLLGYKPLSSKATTTDFNPCLVFIPSLYLGSSQVKPLGKYGAGIKTFRCNKEYHCEHL